MENEERWRMRRGGGGESGKEEENEERRRSGRMRRGEGVGECGEERRIKGEERGNERSRTRK